MVLRGYTWIYEHSLCPPKSLPKNDPAVCWGGECEAYIGGYVVLSHACNLVWFPFNNRCEVSLLLRYLASMQMMVPIN